MERCCLVDYASCMILPSQDMVVLMTSTIFLAVGFGVRAAGMDVSRVKVTLAIADKHVKVCREHVYVRNSYFCDGCLLLHRSIKL